MERRIGIWIAITLLVLPLGESANDEPPAPKADPGSSVLLMTLDTTRADAIGAYGGPAAARTPTLDGLAAAGVRYRRAVAPSPLTLPSHATLMTGVDPPGHGVRGNGTTALGSGLPTLAEVLSARGFATAAFVASRVLDHRFGLDRGFTHYDDGMVAERVGEYGYPERPADEVIDAAISWLRSEPHGRPFLLWVHVYDPHAPYEPPPGLGGTTERDRYLGEVAFVDRELGRLLAAARERAPSLLVAAVGDHGEALGDHGERSHGIFLYRSTIEVPMILAGPGVPRGRVVAEPVGTGRLAATVASLLGIDGELPGPVLPGLSQKPSPQLPPIFSEATMPAEVYGWAPLAAVTDGRWRYIDAPRPELYDVEEDPGELANLVEQQPERAARLRTVLAGERARAAAAAEAADLDDETRAALLALGYLEAVPGAARDPIDPKDGIGLLAEFERAKELLAAGHAERAREILEPLVARNPSNLPFLSRLAEAELATGDGDAAVATWSRALELRPRSEFVRLALADGLRRLGRSDEARRAFRDVLELDPRSAPAWLGLAGLAETPEQQGAVLSEAATAGTGSVVVLLEAARLEAEAGRADEARRLLDRAAALMPAAAVVWLERAELEEAEGRLDDALAACRTASELEPANPATALCSGRVYLDRGEPQRARAHLRRAAVLGRGTPAEAEAEALLGSISD